LYVGRRGRCGRFRSPGEGNRAGPSKRAYSRAESDRGGRVTRRWVAARYRRTVSRALGRDLRFASIAPESAPLTTSALRAAISGRRPHPVDPAELRPPGCSRTTRAALIATPRSLARGAPSRHRGAYPRAMISPPHGPRRARRVVTRRFRWPAAKPKHRSIVRPTTWWKTLPAIFGGLGGASCPAVDTLHRRRRHPHCRHHGNRGQRAACATLDDDTRSASPTA